MQVSREVNEWSGDRIARQTITIVLGPDDDPHANLNGLVSDLGLTSQETRLTAFLNVYSGMERLERADDQEKMLRMFGFVASMLRSRTKDVMWFARDTLGMSWRALADAMEMPTSNVQRAVQRYRHEMADRGYWRDHTGIRKDTSQVAHEMITLFSGDDNA